MPQRPVVRPRGLSLQAVLMFTAILTVLVALMTSLFTMTLNFTQTFYNGESALNEAEAGIAAVRARLAADAEYGTARTEEIRGRVTSDAQEGDAWHVVTFRSLAGFPVSTNNRSAAGAAGSLSRTVPADSVHVVSTGYCRGQYRTVEALFRHPPFPIALASSGKVFSKTPLVIQGTTSLGAYEAGDDDRPGHLVCNSTEGVTIERGPAGPGIQTYISGFVRSLGPVEIEKPAEVRGGVHPLSDRMDLPRMNLESFRNQNASGVVNVTDGSLSDQVMDVMYYCGHDLVIEGSAEMENAFLFVDGNLKVTGSVRGTGAIVATGNVTVQNGTTLNGTNRVALLAGGDVDLRGNANFFQGIVYSKGNLNAKSITVLGNVILESEDPGKGRATLDDVRLVSNSESARLKFTATSSSEAKTQNDWWNPPFPLGGGGEGQNVVGVNPAIVNHAGEVDGGLMEGWDNTGDPNHIIARFEGQIGTLELGVFVGAPPDAADLIAQAESLVAESRRYKVLWDGISSLEGELNSMPSDDPDRDSKERELEAARAELVASQAAYDRMVATLANNYADYYRSHAAGSGRYKTSGKTIDVEVDYDFDLNQFLPEGATMRMTYWKVYPRRM